MVHVSRTVRISVAEHLVRLAFSKVHTIRRGSLASTPKATEGLKGGTTCIILSTAIFTDSMVIFSGHKFASKCVANTKIYQDWMLQHFQWRRSIRATQLGHLGWPKREQSPSLFSAALSNKPCDIVARCWHLTWHLYPLYWAFMEFNFVNPLWQKMIKNAKSQDLKCIRKICANSMKPQSFWIHIQLITFTKVRVRPGYLSIHMSPCFPGQDTRMK